MHGADNAAVVFGDGLDNHNEEIVIKNGMFDILVANPPYSVSAFKNHLELKNNKQLEDEEIFNCITKDGSGIETLFVVRTAQLLKPKGIAAVVLPSSILNNGGNSYIKARESLLKNFEIKSIVCFGSKTFGATGTNTVVLFLQKYDEPPIKADIVKDNVNAIFTNENLTVKSDIEILDEYCSHIEVQKDDYVNFVNNAKANTDYSEYENHKYFGMYYKAYKAGTEYKTAEKQDASAKKKDGNEHTENRTKAFYSFVLETEKEKVYYFALCYKQNTLIVTAPSDNSEQEKFLGYGWSNRKRDEGIKIKNEALCDTLCGYLYNDSNPQDSIARYVKDTFLGIYRSEGTMQKYVNTASLKDMLDFTRTTFDKAIKTSVTKKVEVKSKYELKTVAEITTLIESGSRPEGGAVDSGVLSLGGEHIDNISGYLNLENPKYVSEAYFDAAKRGKLNKDDLLICKDGALTGKVALVRNELTATKAMINEHVFLVRCSEILTQKFLFNYLYSTEGQSLLKENITGAAQGGLNSTNFKSIKLPLPPLEVQQQIVAECEQIDDDYKNARDTIENCKQQIESIMQNVQGETKKLGEIYKIASGGTPSRKENSYWVNGTIPWLTTTEVTNEVITETNEFITEEGLKNSSAKLYPKDSLVIAMYGQGTTRGRTAKLGIESTTNQACAVLYEKLDEFETDYVWAFLKSQYDNIRNISHGSAQPNLNADDIKNFAIPVPPLEIQKQIVTQITAIEGEIQKAKDVMAQSAELKSTVLKKYLE